jgi:hypothetical protein
MRWRRASYGYTGRGAYSTIAFIEPNGGAVPLVKDAIRIFL